MDDIDRRLLKILRDRAYQGLRTPTIGRLAGLAGVSEGAAQGRIAVMRKAGLFRIEYGPGTAWRSVVFDGKNGREIRTAPPEQRRMNTSASQYGGTPICFMTPGQRESEIARLYTGSYADRTPRDREYLKRVCGS